MRDALATTPARIEVGDSDDLAEGPPAGGESLRRRLRWPAFTTLVLQTMLVLGDRMPSVDAMSYFETGRNFVSGNGYTRQGAPEMHFPPVAPVALGVLERLTGSEMHALRVWNLVWGLAIVAVLTFIGWYLSRDDDTTVATAWLATAAPGVVALSIRGGSGSELATIVLVLSSALLVLTALDPRIDRSQRQRLRRLQLGGALVGLAYLTRPESLLPGATIGLAVIMFSLATPDRSWRTRLGLAVKGAASFGLVALLFVGPYVVYTHSNSGSWSLTSKTKDASIDAWRAVAEGDRLERDQVLYSIQPDGVSLGPETRSLTAIARDHPRGWVTIAWINTRTIFDHYLGALWRYGPVWDLIPLFVTVPALVQIWVTRRSRSTLLFATLAAWPLFTCFIFFALPRYLMLTTAVLIPFGAWGLVRWTRRFRVGVQRGIWWGVGVLSVVSMAVASWSLLPGSNFPERTEQRTAGLWLEENTPEDARVMTRSFHVQSYADRDVVAFPSAEYLSMLEFARRMGVSYIVADELTIRRRRPELYGLLMRESGAPDGLEIAHEFTERGRTVKIYRLDPPAPPTDQPPLPLGYVSD